MCCGDNEKMLCWMPFVHEDEGEEAVDGGGGHTTLRTFGTILGDCRLSPSSPGRSHTIALGKSPQRGSMSAALAHQLLSKVALGRRAASTSARHNPTNTPF